MHNPRVILASQSPRRRELLALIGVPHEVMPADLDESYLPGETPREHCERLAREKAKAVAASLNDGGDAVVIGSDTIVVVDGEVLGKPRNYMEASAMLRRLSGRSHRVMTGVAVAWNRGVQSDVEEVDVTFRELDDAHIESYVATDEPMDKAGAYGIQGYGATIVERVDGDYFAVMGLPLQRLVRLWERMGLCYPFGPLESDIGNTDELPVR